MNSRWVRAIFRKELRGYRHNGFIVLTMAIFPLIFVIQPLIGVFALPPSASAELSQEHLGRWDEAVDTANAVIGWEHDHGGQYRSQMAHQIKAQVLLWRGEVDAAAVLAREFLPRARAIDDLQLLVPALAVAVAVAHAAGEPTAARGLVEEVRRVVGDRGGGRWYLSQHIAELARVCVALGQRVTGEALAAQAHAGVARHRHGLLAAHGVLAEGRGELRRTAAHYDEAAAHWADYGHQLERASALLGAGRCLLALGRPEGQLRLQEARAVLAPLSAWPLLAEADAALGSARWTGRRT